MANITTTAAVTSLANPPPAPFSEPWSQALRRALMWVGGKPMLASGFRMSPGQVKILEHGRLTLSQRLSAGRNDPQVIDAHLVKLIAAYPPRETGSAIAGAVVAGVFRQALRDRPAWAAKIAVDRIIEGKTPFGKPWGPTATEFALLVEDVMRPYRDALADLSALLLVANGADQETDPEVKEMVVDGFDALKMEFGGSRRGAAVREQRTDEEVTDELRAGVADRLKDYPRAKPRPAPSDIMDDMGYGETMEPG